MGAITIAALSILTCLTAVQIGRWRNSATLFKYTESLVPDNRMIENNLGTILGENGKYDEAAAHFEKALRTEPDFLEDESATPISGPISDCCWRVEGKTDGSGGTAERGAAIEPQQRRNTRQL